MPARPEDGTICDVIRYWADVQPGAPALYDDECRTPLSYRGLVEVMDRIRASLNEVGFGRGDRVALVHSGGAEMAMAVFGIASCATVVPLNARYTAPEFLFELRDRDVRAVVIERGLDSAIRGIAQRLRVPVLEIARRDESVVGDVTIKGDAEGQGPATVGPAQAEDLAFVLATSGTTSRSKIVPQRHRHLLVRAQVQTETFHLTQGDRCLSTRPLHYGAQPLVAAVFYSGGSLALMSRFEVKAFFENLERFSPTWCTGSHIYHRRIFTSSRQYEKEIRSSRLRLIHVGSGWLDAEIADGLERVFRAPVIEAYASTETSRIAANPLPPGMRKRGTVGKPVNSEVAIRGYDGRPLAAGARGEVVVRGAQVFEGYENDAEANAEAFVDGWFRTGDEGYFDEDGYLTLTGRIKEMINRGGEKVSPAEVDATLIAHPDVREAVTFPIPHPTLGEEVAVAVVPETGTALTDQVLTGFLLKRLSGFKVPRRFFFVDSIPKSDAGKVQRYRLAELLAAGTMPAPSLGSPSDRDPTPLEARLQALWMKALRLPRVGLDENFFLLGGDSLQAVELFLDIERELGHRLPRTALFEAGTVREMAALIEANTPPRCLVPIRPEGSRPPFFCVHDGNGHVLNFRDLARHLGEDQPFYGIQCPGLDGKEMPFTEIESMAAHYVREIKKVRPEGPYYIGGYSFGGRVAYVMAQQLRARGEEVALLALLDTSSGEERRPMTLRYWLNRHIARLRGLSLRDVPAYIAMRFENLALEARRATLTRLYGRALALYRSRGRPLPRWLYRPVEANDLIRRATRLTPYEGDAVLLQTAESADRHSDGKNGWGALDRGGLDVIPVTGQHYQIVKEPHVRALAATLAVHIDAVVAPTSACRTAPDASGPQVRDAPSPPQATSPRSR